MLDARNAALNPDEESSDKKLVSVKTAKKKKSWHSLIQQQNQFETNITRFGRTNDAEIAKNTPATSMIRRFSPSRGLPETQSKRTLCVWSIQYARTHLLPIYEQAFPDDSRLRNALLQLMSWLEGRVKYIDARNKQRRAQRRNRSGV
ncbi:MAG: hypothetical protein R2912_10380 [Eubacteriales bacterium]